MCRKIKSMFIVREKYCKKDFTKKWKKDNKNNLIWIVKDVYKNIIELIFNKINKN